MQPCIKTKQLKSRGQRALNIFLEVLTCKSNLLLLPQSSSDGFLASAIKA